MSNLWSARRAPTPTIHPRRAVIHRTPARTRGGAAARLLALALFLATPGCYHYRVVVPGPDPATDYERRRVDAFFWGLVQEDVPATDCLSNALDEVRVTTNAGYLVASVLSLGLWVPLDVAWRCAKAPSPNGEI